MTQLNEGLREGDLKDLVLPLISIDEYESKINDKALVIGFFVSDTDPARDLNRFIQKSAVQLLDTDVSPAPNKEGYFMVFVEIMRDSKAPRKILDLCETIEGLVSITDWTFKAYRHKGVFELTDENIRKYVRLVPEKREEITRESLADFFHYSFLDEVLLEGNTLSLKSGSWNSRYTLVDFGTYETIAEKYGFTDKPFDLSESYLYHSRQLVRNLGWEWTVNAIDGHLVVHSPKSDFVVILDTV